MYRLIMTLVRTLADRTHGWVTALCVLALSAGGVALGVAGLRVHQPAVTRIGILLVVAAIVLAVLVVRARQPRERTGRKPAATPPADTKRPL